MQGSVSVISSLKLENPLELGFFRNCDAENLQNFVQAQVAQVEPSCFLTIATNT